MNLVTRLDFDGIVSAVMIHEMEPVSGINFADPKTLEEGGLLDILERGDIIAHLPIHPDAGIWFHNHDTSHIDQRLLEKVKGKFGVAPSTAHQVYEYYKSPKLERYVPLVNVADKIGTANLTEEDILAPKDWMMVSYTLDPRFSQDHSFGMLIMDGIKGGKSAAEVLTIPQVARRVELYKKDEERFLEELKKASKVMGNVIITDFRELYQAPRGNRFRVFVEYPDGNVHLRIEAMPGFRTKVSVSRSIINHTCNVHIGHLMEEYGGGGMEGAGTCMVGKKAADEKIVEIVKKLKG